MSNFDVDFPHVRKHGDIVAVVSHYGVKLSGEGVQRKGLCPFHEDKRPSFNVNVEKRVFHCFACTAKGNVIDFVQQIDPTLKNPRLAAKQVAELSNITARPNGPNGSHSTAPKHQAVSKDVAPGGDRAVVEPASEPVAIVEATGSDDGTAHNRPLSFELKLEALAVGGTDPAHALIARTGMAYERLTALGIGMARRGSMKDRLAIPIYNKDRELVAYCGRHVGPPLAEAEPKYKFPSNFRKEFELYGWDAAQNFKRVVLVESFLSVIKHGGVSAAFNDTGFGVASVMGTSISDRQVELLLETRPEVVVCFDGDEAGLLGSLQVVTALTQAGLWATIRNCAAGGKPHHQDTATFCQTCSAD